MRLLVLGGTRFVGRAVVEEAVSHGYDVTTFSRGQSGHTRPGVEAIHGDRTSEADLRPLAEREWDAVLDTSVLAPAHVAASARILRDHTRHYTYVSSLSVYGDFPRTGVTENSPALACPPDATGTVETLGYGELKAGSERAVLEALPGRCLIARPGLIIGPHDNVGRLPWWLKRLARGGEVVAPGAPDRPVMLTDVHDLARWLIDNTRRGIPGIVNIPGAVGTTIGEVLTAGAKVTAAEATASGGTAATLRWVPDEVLLSAGVRPWEELPFWVPDTGEWAGTWITSGDRAIRTGMRYRPVTDSLHDTWQWLKRQAGTPVWDTARPGTGLDPAREREILASLESR